MIRADTVNLDSPKGARPFGILRMVILQRIIGRVKTDASGTPQKAPTCLLQKDE